MAMVELTQRNGQAVFVNPRHVQTVVPVLSPQGGSTAMLCLASGKVLIVVDTVGAVVDLLDGGDGRREVGV